jgi:formamidopyrimidine-DNA glycosylase
MPELPEVEVTRRGIAPALIGRRVTGVTLRTPALRYPLPRSLASNIRGAPLEGIDRRGKYLLLHFAAGPVLLHLGMSGTLRLVPPDAPPGKHDHVDIAFGNISLRMNDPRRFGALLWIEGEPTEHPLLASLGVEPLERGFTGKALHKSLHGRSAAIKQAIMDSHVVVGVGNIYASESLFRAGISPRTTAGRVSLVRLEKLVTAIKETLRAAIRAGGSTLRDFFGSDGDPGHFQLEHLVYGREGEPCRRCGTTIRMIRQGQRATFYCSKCQT